MQQNLPQSAPITNRITANDLQCASAFSAVGLGSETVSNFHIVGTGQPFSDPLVFCEVEEFLGRFSSGSWAFLRQLRRTTFSKHSSGRLFQLSVTQLNDRWSCAAIYLQLRKVAPAPRAVERQRTWSNRERLAFQIYDWPSWATLTCNNSLNSVFNELSMKRCISNLEFQVWL